MSGTFPSPSEKDAITSSSAMEKFIFEAEIFHRFIAPTAIANSRRSLS
jgi:hypothetical protein